MADNEPLLLTVKTVSAPFNAARVVEVKFQIEGPYGIGGELYLRVPAAEASQWLRGDRYCSRLRRI